MARVQPYERAVDAVVIHTTLDIDQIQNGVKIKEEPTDTTSNIDATSDTEDSTLVKNYYSLVDHDYHHDESSLSKKDTLYKDINNTENRHSSNDDSVHLNDVNKTVNVERKRAGPKEEIHNTELEFKKQKSSNKVSNNKNTNTLRTTENVKEEGKQQNIKLDCKTKIGNNRRKNRSATCDVCFRKFSSVRNCEFHKQYYGFNDSICRFCKRHFPSQSSLHSHVCTRQHQVCTYRDHCNFCSRTFKSKILLQSHLFHMHGELIDCNNTIKHKTSRSENVNTSPEGDTLRTSANQESYSRNLRKDNFKTEKINTTNNVNKSWDDINVMDTEKSKIEKSFNNEISPTNKRLRQPTLTEYLELSKKKRDIKPSPSKLNPMKGDFPKSDNLPKQTAHSTLEQTTVKHELCSPKKPLVRLYADVEMMKSFLENLPNTVVKDKVTEDRTSDSISSDREVPYNLRSQDAVSFMEASSNSGMKKNTNVSKKSRVNIELNTKREQNAIKVDKVDPKVDWQIIMARFKFKECTIPLTRCDKQPKNSNQISTIDAMKNTSLTTQCNSTLLQERDAPNEMTLKNLEVSLERLTAVPTADIKVKTELDVETHINNGFVCKICKKSFLSKIDRHVHIKSSHLAYMSSICDARYTLKHKLLQHYLFEHLFKQNQCCVCYMSLPDYEALKQHLNVHCLKYIQREDDKYPVDIELKCNLTKKPLKCLYCNKRFSSQTSQSSFEVHQSYCRVQEKMEKDEENSIEEASAYPKDIPEIQHKNTDENIVTCHERINPDDLCKASNSDCVEKKSNKHQISLHSKKEPEVFEANRNLSINNNLNEKKIEFINKSQDSKKLLENINSAISNQNIANTQLDDVTTKIMTYPCDICGKQFQNPKNLEIHIRSFSFTTDICPMCGTGFSSKRLLQTHMTAAHVPQISRTYNFHCVFCNQGFFKKHDLRPHILHLHGQQVLNSLTRNLNVSQEKSDQPINFHSAMCNVCNLVFETHDRYVEHRMYYYKNHTFTCSLCAQNFQGMYMFHHHNKLVHYSEDKRKAYNFICDICNEGFNHESHFYSHNMHVHSNEVNSVETAKRDRNRSNYSPNVQEKIRNFCTDQQKQNKQPSNEYTCEICQLKCTDMNDMVKHRELYSNDGDFRCDKCERRCRTFHLLDQHRKLTHLCSDVYDGHVLCHVCGEVLETVIALECHEKHFHSNTDNNTNWKNCDQMSSSNITYKEHPDKPKNDTCKVTEYNCVFCDMKFPTANAAQTHIVYVHMDDMIAKRSILKLTLPIVNNDDIQKQFIESNPASTSSASTSSASTSSASTSSAPISSASTSSTSTSENNLIQILPRPSPMIQQPNIILRNIPNNTTAKNEMHDKTIKSLKKFRTIRLQNNNISEITPISAIPCFNKSKDIFTINTFGPNTKSKANTLVPLSTRSTTFRTVTPRVEFGNNNSIVLPTGATISKAIVSNIGSKDNTSVPSSGSTNDLRKSSDVSLKSGSINDIKANSISQSNKFITIKSKITPVSSTSTGSLSTFRRVMPEKRDSNEITNQKCESVNSLRNDYSCPLCPLEYPSLMFFHAHLKYAHADSIRPSNIRVPIMTQILTQTQAWRANLIDCLLCPCSFPNETKYKKHLRNTHTYYVYIPNSQETTKIDNVRNPLTTQTNINTKRTIPETITVDDDDDNVKNISDQQAAEVTATPDHGRQNEKIGKLRVKSFAKIIENLSADSANCKL